MHARSISYFDGFTSEHAALLHSIFKPQHAFGHYALVMTAVTVDLRYGGGKERGMAVVVQISSLDLHVNTAARLSQRRT